MVVVVTSSMMVVASVVVLYKHQYNEPLFNDSYNSIVLFGTHNPKIRFLDVYLPFSLSLLYLTLGPNSFPYFFYVDDHGFVCVCS